MGEKEPKAPKKEQNTAEAAEGKEKKKVAAAPSANRQRSQWTLKKASKFARRFMTEADWKAGHPSSYKAATYWGWLDTCCAHMKSRLEGSGAIPLNARRKPTTGKSAGRSAATKKKTATPKRKSA